MVIKLRTYYIFKINKYFSYIYNNKPYKLYKMLEEIFHVNDYDMILSYKIYEQVAITFDKNELNKYIKNNYSTCNYYLTNKSSHIYSDNNEYTKLVINNSNLKIKTNINNPIFFKDIVNYSDNIFVCDFINKDYFWLEKIIKKDGQSDKIKVK